MSTETDDLRYYETELPKVIAGVRRGEKWEIMWLNTIYDEPKWVNPVKNTLEYLCEHLGNPNYRVRLAPVPVVKWWDCPADVPGPVCWIRENGGNGVVCMIIGIGECSVSVSQKGHYTWREMEGMEYSTDRIHWKPCVKPEGGK